MYEVMLAHLLLTARDEKPPQVQLYQVRLNRQQVFQTYLPVEQ